MTLSFFMLIAFTLALLYMVLSNISYRKLRIKYIMIFFVVWTVLFQSRAINEIFYLDFQRYQRDVMIMNTIIHDLGLEHDKPIVFVGFIENPLPEREAAGISIFDFARRNMPIWELFDVQHYEFFVAHNFPLVRPQASDIDLEELQIKISDMPSWPEEGYILEHDNFIIVKLGYSPLDLN